MKIDSELELSEIVSGDNLAEYLTESDLASIGSKCKSGVESDEASRADWMERHDKAMDLALQRCEDKSFPWEGSSNVIFPAITTGAMQFAARAMPSIIPGANLVKCKVMGDDDGLYEVMVGPDGQPVIDPQTGQPQSREILAPGIKAAKASRVSRHMSYQLLCEIPNWEDDTDCMMHYLPIGGCAFRKNSFDRSKGRVVSKWLPGSQVCINMDAESVATAARKTEYFELYPYQVQEKVARQEYFIETGKNLADMLQNADNPDDEQALCKFAQVHCRIDLDGDKYPEPYIVIMHWESGHVFSIKPDFDLDGIEVDGDTIISIEPATQYIKYDFIPNPDNGIYGIGFGWLLGPLNEQINTTINQLNDAGTLQNTPMGFVARGLRMKEGDMHFKPGEFKQIDTAGGSIRENLYELTFNGPSPVLFNLLGLMINATQDITSVKDIMTGGMEQNVAPTTAMTLVEQGSKQFNAIFKRIHRALSKELKQLFDINSRTLEQDYYFTFLDERAAVAREDYDAASLDIVPYTDPAMATDAKKQARTQGLMQASRMFPEINRQKLFMDVMEGLEVEDPQEWWSPPQPQGPSMDDQAKMMKAQADMVRAQADQREAQTDAVQAMSDFVLKNSAAILNLAKAESEEEGRQLEQYIGQIRDMRMENLRDEQRRVQPVANSPSNGGASQPAGGVLGQPPRTTN